MFLPFRDVNPTRHAPVATVTLIVLNVLALLGLNRLDPAAQQAAVYQYGFVPARILQLEDPRAIQIVIEMDHDPGRWLPVDQGRNRIVLEPVPRQIFFSLLSCMFLHGGWVHLLGNMWFLWIFGNNVEDRLGRGLFVLFYLVGGLVATASHWLVDPHSTTPVIGASGAVAAILGAYLVTWPGARVHTLVFLLIFVTIIDVPAALVLGVWFVTQLLAGVRQANMEGLTAGVAWWAHIGGFLFGMALMPLVDWWINGRRPFRPGPPVAPDEGPYLV